MPHFEHSSMVIIVGVRGILGELSACRRGLTLLPLTLLFMVANFSTVFAFDGLFCLLGSAWKLPLLRNVPRLFPFSCQNWELFS